MSDTKLSPGPSRVDSPGSQAVPDDRKRILLVEGDGFTRLVLLLRLRLAGFGVDFTSNGILGLGKLRSCHPDILLVELKLNGLSGLEVIKAARAEPDFGNRPIYVFTQANKMNRATRKELDALATTLLDKSVITREDVVQIFSTTYLSHDHAEEKPAANQRKAKSSAGLSEAVLSGAIEDLIAGVREQTELFTRKTGSRAATGAELLSRVSSLASCAKEAELPNLARQAKALQNFLNQLCSCHQGYTDDALTTVTRAVDVMSRIPIKLIGKARSLTRFSVVFVDESPESSRAMEDSLLNAGFDPLCLEDPARAREHLAANRTDLIVANLVLPEAHGLGLAEIRQLPLHTQTPIVFGPESIIVPPPREDLPLRAPRLDKSPILLTELVVRALNQVQAKKIAAQPGQRSAAAEAPAAPVAQPCQPCEDSVELFARTPPQKEEAVVDRSARNGAVTTGAVHPVQQFSHLFASGIPDQPFLRVESDVPDPDREAEEVVKLEETSVDGSQADEQPLETLPLSDLQAEVPELPQKEPTIENQTVSTEWVAAPVTDAGQSDPTNTNRLEFVQNNVAAGPESAASITNYVEVMNNQLQAAPADYPHQGEANQSSEGAVSRDDLAARVCEAEMALYHAKEQIDERDKTIQSLQKQLGSQNAIEGQPGRLPADGAAQPNPVEQAAQKRCVELEQEVAALRQAFEGLNGFSEPQPPTAETAKRVQELEQRLSQNAGEIEKQKEAQQHAEAELRQQLDAAAARHAQLEQELAALRQEREQSAKKTASEKTLAVEPGAQQTKSESQSPPAEIWAGVPPAELEQQVRQGVAALARTTAELARERGERQRSQQRAAELNSRLQALHQDLSKTLQAQREDLARISTLEEQQHQNRDAMDRLTADVEQHQAERQLAEDQLQKTKEANTQLRKDLSFFEEANKKTDGARQDLQSRLETTLSTTRDHETRLQQENAERRKLADNLEEARRELQNQSRKRETLEQELQTARDSLQERDARLQKEAAERQRLDQEHDSLHRNLRDGPERDLEFSKVQSALQLEQVERKRQESQLARMRQSALDAAHAARALRTGLRRQVREPIDSLVHSTRSLLEMEMGEEQKKLVEAVLQEGLLVQTRLKEPGLVHTDAPDPAAS
jgi:DNA-binding response OmpR family regulator